MQPTVCITRFFSVYAVLAMLFGLAGVGPAWAADGIWTATGSLTQARFAHTATLLTNGKVLVAGGVAQGPRVSIASAEVYDPAMGTWSTTGSMTDARFLHTSTLLANGKVLVVGGGTVFGDAASAELYDPATGAWTLTGFPIAVRSAHAATILADGRVLAVGGYSYGSPASSAELYNPIAGAWTATGDMGNVRSFHTVTLLANGKVLVVGGQSAPYSAELYDPASGIWTATASTTSPRAWHTATLLANGKVLVAGGQYAPNSAELYDPATGTWTATTSMATGYALPAATLLANGKVLITVGSSGTIGEVYDPATGTWNATGSLIDGLYFWSQSVTLLANGGALLVGGTTDGTLALARAEVYVSSVAENGVVTTPAGTNVAVSTDATLPDGSATPVSLTFDSVVASGQTTITTSSMGPPPPAGFKLGNPPVYYDLTTTAVFSGTATVCFNWTEGQFHNEGALRLWHLENNVWQDVTSSVNQTTNTICGQTTSLSPFIIAEKSYAFSGFFQPVDNLPTVNGANAGSAIPVKFSLGGYQGMAIFDAGSPRLQAISCQANATVQNVEQTVASNGSGLSYDATSDQYVFVWKTAKAFAGSCMQLLLDFNDGTQQRASFMFTR